MCGASLTRRFQASRLKLGLDLTTPYFNAGLMVIDRAAWRAAELGERAVRALRAEPERYPFMEQDALNATLKGEFRATVAALQFHGRVPHARSRGDDRADRAAFRQQPEALAGRLARRTALRRALPELVRRFALAGYGCASPPGHVGRPLKTATRRAFAERLTAFLATQRFVDA